MIKIQFVFLVALSEALFTSQGPIAIFFGNFFLYSLYSPLYSFTVIQSPPSAQISLSSSVYAKRPVVFSSNASGPLFALLMTLSGS